MFKFFRRIRKSFIDSGSVKRYLLYGAGEVFLVMIGILLALQVNNWNEQRKNIAKEDLLLTSIHNEFMMNRSQLDTVIYYDTKALESCKSLIERFPIDISNDDLNEIGKHIWNITFHWTFNPSQGSISSITNSNTFDIIRNTELRELLVVWQDLVSDFQEDEQVGKAIVQNHIDPMLSKFIDYNFDLNDERNDFNILTTLEFEFYIRARHYALKDIYEGNEFRELDRSLNRIIELSNNQK